MRKLLLIDEYIPCRDLLFAFFFFFFNMSLATEPEFKSPENNLFSEVGRFFFLRDVDLKGN